MHPPRKHARLLVAGAAGLALPLLAAAGDPQFRLPSFPGLREQATESVDVDLGWLPLYVTSWLMDAGDQEAAAVGKTIRSLKSVQIRSYRFDSEFTYPQAEIDQLRAQLAQPGWSPLVAVRKHGDAAGKDRENVDIYVALEDKKVKGLVIIACEARELTVVNLVGTIDLDQIASLRKTFVADRSLK
ncbi:MAG TPA: DUF4252 domain-containing protein [Steroidobacteraceae bacterium]|nr:DUF4252 domain-containing protein [Steroidobacteraceae bacterium]